jgi:hypothetical protein
MAALRWPATQPNKTSAPPSSSYDASCLDAAASLASSSARHIPRHRKTQPAWYQFPPGRSSSLAVAAAPASGRASSRAGALIGRVLQHEDVQH